MRVTQLHRTNGLNELIVPHNFTANSSTVPPQYVILHRPLNCGTKAGTGEYLFLGKWELQNPILYCIPRVAEWKKVRRKAMESGMNECLLQLWFKIDFYRLFNTFIMYIVRSHHNFHCAFHSKKLYWWYAIDIYVHLQNTSSVFLKTNFSVENNFRLQISHRNLIAIIDSVASIKKFRRNLRTFTRNRENSLNYE